MGRSGGGLHAEIQAAGGGLLVAYAEQFEGQFLCLAQSAEPDLTGLAGRLFEVDFGPSRPVCHQRLEAHRLRAVLCGLRLHLGTGGL